MVLKVPNNVVSLHNNASTYKPFDPSGTLGDTTPTQPYPPPPSQSGGGCGVFGEILVVVVAIVVTYFTAGAASEASASLVTSVFGASAAASAAGTAATVAIAAAATAAASSIASQAVGIAIGQQSGFSWQEVGVAALAAGLTAGLTEGTPLGSIGTEAGDYSGMALRGVVNSVVDQGSEIALGEQHGFNWSQVALAAVSAPADAVAGNIVGQGAESFLNTDEDQFLSGFTRGITNIGVRLALGGKVDVDAAAADAFSNALGNSLVTMEQAPELGSFTPAQQADYQATIDASAQSAIDATNPDIQLSLAANQSMMDTAQQAYGDNHAYAMDLQDAYNSADNVGADLQNMAYDVGYGLQDNPDQGLPSASSLFSGISLPQIGYPSGGGLTMDDLIAARAAIGSQPAQGAPDGVRLFDADALRYQWFSRRMTDADYAAQELLRGDLEQAMGAARGDAQLVAEFGPDATSEDKLNGAIRISGGYFGPEAAQNLLNQINNGNNALNLTYTRGESEQYFQNTFHPDQILAAAADNAVGFDGAANPLVIANGLIDNLRNSDSLLPQPLTITENGVNRSINTAVNGALLVSGFAGSAVDAIALAGESTAGAELATFSAGDVGGSSSLIRIEQQSLDSGGTASLFNDAVSIGARDTTAVPDVAPVEPEPIDPNATTTLYHGTSSYFADEAVENQAISTDRLSQYQVGKSFNSGLYTTTQPETADYYANLLFARGSGGGPATLQIDVPTQAFNEFVEANDIALETSVPRMPGQTETFIPLKNLGDFNKIPGTKYSILGN
jgi:hypothetical protein